MDADGIPLSFDIFPGNQNEQTTLKPLEQKIIRDFNCSEFIFCSDSGLGSLNNRRFNSFSRRAYVITHSLKKWRRKSEKLLWIPHSFAKSDLRSLSTSVLWMKHYFRIMKEEFESRPAFVRREDRIKAHFMICYISLIVYRLLEKKVGWEYTCDQLIRTLKRRRLCL